MTIKPGTTVKITTGELEGQVGIIKEQVNWVSLDRGLQFWITCEDKIIRNFKLGDFDEYKELTLPTQVDNN